MQVNGAIFETVTILTIIAAVPMVEVLLRVSGSSTDRMRRRQQMLGALLLGAAGALVAAGLEVTRRGAPVIDVPSRCAPMGVKMSAPSGLLMALPFALMGTSAALSVPAVLAFAYQQSPPSTRNSLQAFQLLAAGSMSQAYTAAMTQAAGATGIWTDDLNDGRLELYYIFTALMAICAVPLYLAVHAAYVEKDWEAPASAASQPEANDGGSGKAVGQQAVAPTPASKRRALQNKQGPAPSISVQNEGSGGFGAIAARSAVSRGSSARPGSDDAC